MTRLFITAALAFALGVLLRDVAQDYAKPNPVCERAKENAERFGRALADLLNRQTIDVAGSLVSCRVKHPEEKA